MPPRDPIRFEPAANEDAPEGAELAPLAPQPARAGRPTVARAAEIDQAILTAARSLFLEDGFAATSMEAIAAAAQVSKSTLYARYPTKSAVLRAVLKPQIARWSSDHIHRGPLPKDLKQRLQHLARGTLAAQMAPESLPYHRLAQRVAFDEREVAQALTELALQPAIADLAEEIRRGASELAMPPQNAERVAQMVHAMLYGWWAQKEPTGGATREEAEAFADHAIDVLFYGRAAW